MALQFSQGAPSDTLGVDGATTLGSVTASSASVTGSTSLAGVTASGTVTAPNVTLISGGGGKLNFADGMARPFAPTRVSLKCPSPLR